MSPAGPGIGMRPRDRHAAILAAVTLGVGLGMLGSAPRWATCLTAALALATVLPQALSTRAAVHRSPLMWLFGLAAALTAVQLVPLPAAVVGVVAPARLEVAVDNAAALGRDPPGWLALSHDPPATAVELAKLAAYLAFAFVCTRLAGSTQGRRWLAHMVAIAGAAMAGLALVHHLLGLDTLLGIYRPETPASTYIAPLLNENHLAGFLAFSVPLCLVLALLGHGVRRLAWLGAAVLAAGTALLTESRGGAVALVTGVVLTGVLLAVHRRRHGERLTRPPARLSALVPAGVVAACGVVLLATFTAGGVRQELASTSAAELRAEDSKFGVWRAASQLVAENLWTGVGRGGFEPTFTRVHHSGVKTYSHVENEYLQALVDWGLPGAVGLALILAWVVLSARERWNRSPLEVGAASGLVALAAHNVVDFNVEMPGVALAVVAVAALLLPATTRRLPGDARRRRVAARGAALAVGAVVVAVAASPFGRTAHADGDAVAALLRASAEARPRGADTDSDPHSDRVVAAAVAQLERHPSDYLIAGLAAEAYFRRRDPRAVDIMNRALALNPMHPGLHVLAARMLIAGGRRGQALIEFALALRHTLEPGAVLADLLRFFPDAEDAAKGLPALPERVPVMANRLVTMGRPDVALAYARRVSSEHPYDHELLLLVSRLALDRGEVKLALEAGEQAYERFDSAANALAYGRALRAAGRLDEALGVARTALDDPRARAESWYEVRLYQLLADTQLALGQVRAARDSLRVAIGLSGGDHRMLADLYRRLASAEQALGRAAQAREARKLAEQHAVGR